MAILNAVKREIVAKIVFYGPGLSGKTANIQKIHETMDPTNVGELTSLATESDRTLFFDFVPIQLGSIAGLNTRFQLFTVPGQVFYNQTRRTVLENTDGVVFVADSQPEQLENNLESLANLEENLAFYGKKLPDIPFVLQFNKQDIPGVMSEEELNKVLNKYGAPSLRASCFEGYGVMETLAKVSTMVLSHLREQMTRKGPAAGGNSGLKRTYSKEGVSDESVVSNMLSNIAASGGAAEAQAAAAGAPPPPPPPAARAAAPAPARAPARPAPARPAPITPAGRPPPPAPAARTVPRPIVPAGAPVTGGSISPEDLLSDLDASTPGRGAPAQPARPPPPPPPAAVPSARPAARATPPPARPAAGAPPRPAGLVPPPPAPKNAGGAAPIPGPPSTAATGSGLRASQARPAEASPGRARTAEELLESMELEERSAPARPAAGNGGRASGGGNEPFVQESRGSFGTAENQLWDSDGDSEPSRPPKGLDGGLFDLDEEDDPSNRTSVVAKPQSSADGGFEEADPSTSLASVPAGLRSGQAGTDLNEPRLSPSTEQFQSPGTTSGGGGKGLALAALLLGLINLAAIAGLAFLTLVDR